MKFYKRLPINTYDPMSKSFAVEADGRIITNTVASMETPSGVTEERPTVLVNGAIRYNESIGIGGELEAYINNRWEIIKTNRQAQVTKQVFENGDYKDTIFGPLAYDIDISRPENVMVYVENVYQVPGVNYELIRSTNAQPLTTSTTVPTLVGFGETVIPLADVSNFNPGIALNGTNLQNNVIVSVDNTASTITVSPGALGVIPAGGLAIAVYSTGTWIRFMPDSVPVPTKPVMTLLGLDGYCPPFEV